MYNIYRTPVDDEGKYPVLADTAETYAEAEEIGHEIIKAFVDYDFTEDDIFITGS